MELTPNQAKSGEPNPEIPAVPVGKGALIANNEPFPKYVLTLASVVLGVGRCCSPRRKAPIYKPTAFALLIVAIGRG